MHSNNIEFLNNRERSLGRAIECLEFNFHRFTDDADDHPDWQGFADRIEKCLIEAKAIRTAIGDKMSELEAAS